MYIFLIFLLTEVHHLVVSLFGTPFEEYFVASVFAQHDLTISCRH